MAINNKTKAVVDALLTDPNTTESQFKTGIKDVTTQVESINSVIDTQGLNIGSAANSIAALETNVANNYYTKTAGDARYYTQTQVDSNFYTKTLADGRYYTKTDSDTRYYTKGTSDGRYLGISAKAADANLLDGVNSSSFLRSDAADSKTSGTLTFSDNVVCAFGSSNDAEFFCNGAHLYLDLNSGIGNFYIRDGATVRYTFDDAGSFTASGNVTAYSDRSVKENIEVIPDALAKVNSISGYTFDRIDMGGMRQTGVVAQELKEVLPEAVVEMSDGKLSVAYGNIVGLLIEAIKELSTEVESLKSK